MSAERQGKGAAIAAVAAYGVLWGAAVFYLFSRGNEDWFTGVFVLAVFGLALPGLGWLLTRGAEAPAIEVKRPAVEGGAVLVYLALYAVIFLGYGLTALCDVFPEERAEESLVLGAKLVAHVALPALVLMMLGARLAPLVQAGFSGRKFWRTLIVMGAVLIGLNAVISPSMREIAETGAGPSLLAWAAPATFAWVAIEAGLNEEFLFRAFAQTRLSAWFGSVWAGVIVTSLVFGLAHAPGLFLRGGPDTDGWSPDPLQVIAYTIAVLSPIGFLFGLIYARTKSLLLVVLLHACVDVLPNMGDFIRIWT
jgi:membrane protease YdiL (CAAX protease family)